MKQLVVISGKGGTGKTSIVASFAVLAGRTVIADCDVDAPDLHLVLDPEVHERTPFVGASRAVVDHSRCTACGACARLCRFGAIDRDGRTSIDAFRCEGCGVCARFCDARAITIENVANGELLCSTTRCGPMAHARLEPGAESSGKLVGTVRARARDLARQHGCDLVLIDGSPGIGCPVIASITGADLAVVVCEPTVSGLHDLERVLDLTTHFRIPAALLVNRSDLNDEIAERCERLALGLGHTVAGRIRCDRTVTEAQIQRLAAVEYASTGAARDIRAAWESVSRLLAESRTIDLPCTERSAS